MYTHRQQSFLGTLWQGDYPVNTLDNLIGKAAWVNWFGGAGVLPGLASTVRDDSHMLSCQAAVRGRPMLFYFRHSPQGYRLYVREPGKYYGKAVRVYDHAHLGVAALDHQAPSAFTLTSLGGDLVALADLDKNSHQIRLLQGGAAVARAGRQNSAYGYLAMKGEHTETWVLRIHQRNVPWLSTPYEQ